MTATGTDNVSTEISDKTAELDDFDGLTERYQRELLAHCYRMSGSVHEAEDLVQETFLRAWKASADFQGRSSVRTWLYRIATNVCLTNLEGRPRRPLPAGLGTPDQMAGDALEENHEIAWLEPVPDAAVVVAERDSIRLAFIAALQHLPARQRAVLILRDVLRWTAAEVAEALDTTTAAVNSALQRAHATMAERGLTEDTVEPELSTDQEALLARYVDAFWRKDIDTIVSMLRADAIWEMPPFVGWYLGNHNIGKLIDTQCPGGVHDMPMIKTTANGQPAFGLYMRTREGDFVPFHLQVLDLDGDQVKHVGAFFETSLFARFGLPERLPADWTPATTDRWSPGHDTARPRGRAPRPRTLLHRGHPQRRDRRRPRPSYAVRALGPRPAARPHGRRARRVRRGRARRGRPAGPGARARSGRQTPAEGLRAARGLEPRRPPIPCTSAATSSPPRWSRAPRHSRSPCTAGTSPRPSAPPARSPAPWRAACSRSPKVWLPRPIAGRSSECLVRCPPSPPTRSDCSDSSGAMPTPV